MVLLNMYLMTVYYFKLMVRIQCVAALIHIRASNEPVLNELFFRMYAHAISS